MAAPFVPSMRAELEAAAAGGLLAEGHYLDLKRQLGAGKQANRDLAKDLAAFSIDGGVLYVGVREGPPGQAPSLHPVELAGLKERVDQVARSVPRPPIGVRTLEIPSEQEGFGFLVVIIPPSAEAPHMVDGSYWGRSDTTNYVLADNEVVRLHERRAASADRAEALVRAEMARDPAAAQGMNAEAHLFLVAQPVVADPELLLRAVPERNLRRWVGEAIVRGDPGNQWGDGGYSPNIAGMASQLSPRAQGYAAHTYHVAPGRVVLHDDGPRATEEGDLLDIELREDGGVRLFCGRATRERDGSRLFIMPLGSGMTRSVIEAARAVAAVSSYLGSWDLGIGLSNLRGGVDHQSAFNWDVQAWPFSDDAYLTTTRATWEELEASPDDVRQRLTGRLERTLRG